MRAGELVHVEPQVVGRCFLKRDIPVAALVHAHQDQAVAQSEAQMGRQRFFRFAGAGVLFFFAAVVVLLGYLFAQFRQFFRAGDALQISFQRGEIVQFRLQRGDALSDDGHVGAEFLVSLEIEFCVALKVERGIQLDLDGFFSVGVPVFQRDKVLMFSDLAEILQERFAGGPIDVAVFGFFDLAEQIADVLGAPAALALEDLQRFGGEGFQRAALDLAGDVGAAEIQSSAVVNFGARQRRAEGGQIFAEALKDFRLAEQRRADHVFAAVLPKPRQFVRQRPADAARRFQERRQFGVAHAGTGQLSRNGRRRRVGRAGDDGTIAVHFRVHVFGRFEDDAVLVGEERVAHASRELQHQRQFLADAAADEALEFHRQHAVAGDAFHVRHRAAAEVPLQPHGERRLHALAAQVAQLVGADPADAESFRIPREKNRAGVFEGQSAPVASRFDALQLATDVTPKLRRQRADKFRSVVHDSVLLE